MKTLEPMTGVQRVATAFSHAGCFLGMPFVLPLAIWFLFPRFCDDPGDHVREQSVQAMLFHLIVVVVGGALWGATYGLIAIVIIGWPFALVTGLVASAFTLWSTVIMLIAVYKAATGQAYRLPLVGAR